MSSETIIPMPFLLRRLHSLTGLFISLFLIQHLYVNSQAAMFFGDDGKDFIHSVNGIHSIPYLPLVEIFLLAVPIAIHMWWGIVYLRQAKFNSFNTDGSSPSLTKYGRNKAFTWQRITSYILLIGLIGHIVHMRFLNYPEEMENGKAYAVEVQEDPGIRALSERLDVKIEGQGEHLVAVAPDFGTAELYVVRETFKSPTWMALYTLFVLAACFHGFNGLWTFLVSWGITLSAKTQLLFLRLSYGLGTVVAFLGLMAIFGTYWINLK